MPSNGTLVRASGQHGQCTGEPKNGAVRFSLDAVRTHVSDSSVRTLASRALRQSELRRLVTARAIHAVGDPVSSLHPFPCVDLRRLAHAANSGQGRRPRSFLREARRGRSGLVAGEFRMSNAVHQRARRYSR